MMLPLAQWIMQERRQAIAFVCICILTSLIIWPNSILAAAAISLVTLRHGVKEGFILSLWALIPALVFAVYLNAFSALLLIASSLLCSHLLRVTQSWSLTLMLLSLSGLVTSLVLLGFAEPMLSTQVQTISDILNEYAKQANNSDQQALVAMLQPILQSAFLAGLYGSTTVISGFLSVALGRSWQAKLYKPGGFQMEFHQLRLGKSELLVLLAVSLGIFQLGPVYISWIGLGLFPLLIAGIAVFHALASSKKLAKHWFVLFYIVLIFSDPVKMILVVVAMVDTFINIRQKLNRKND